MFNGGSSSGSRLVAPAKSRSSNGCLQVQAFQELSAQLAPCRASCFVDNLLSIRVPMKFRATMQEIGQKLPQHLGFHTSRRYALSHISFCYRILASACASRRRRLALHRQCSTTVHDPTLHTCIDRAFLQTL